MQNTRPLLLLPALAAVLFHLPALTGEWVYDDVGLLARNPHLDAPDAARSIFTRDYGQDFASRDVGYYRPLFVLLARTVRRVAGPSPFASHAVSLALLGVAAVLLSWTGWRAGERRGLGPWVAAGCLYAAHPTRVEVVSLFAALPDLLVEIVALAVLGLAAVRAAPFRPVWRGALTAALALAAGLTKESAFIVLPVLGLAAVAAGLRVRSADAIAAGLGVLPGLLAAYLPRAAVHAPDGHVSLASLTAGLVEGSGRATDSLAWALTQLAVPGRPVLWLTSTTAGTPSAAACLAAFFALWLTLWVALLWRGRLAESLFAAWAGGGMLALVATAVVGLPYAQRYITPAPVIALLCLAVCGASSPRAAPLPSAVTQRRRLLVIALAAVYVAAHGAFTFSGSLRCATKEGLYSLIVEAAPSEVPPLVALAVLRSRNGTAAELESCARRVTVLDPSHPMARQLQGMAAKRYLDERRPDAALRWLDWALRADPADPDKRALRAAALATVGRLDEAAASIGRALAARPTDPAYLRLRDQISAAAQAAGGG
jgi:tetratricopeptide (TPR) repeat protein